MKRNINLFIVAGLLSVFILEINAQDRVVTTGVPFLLITPDARAAGMGDIGVATSSDAFSQQWNPAKYSFVKTSGGFGISYTPYLSKLVNDIFLGNVTYYRKLNERSSWATSFKYFSLGDVQFNQVIAGSIVDQGVERPNELTLDLSYSLKLSEFFSMAVAVRYIRSDLKLSSDSDNNSANSLGVDIAGFYQSKSFEINGMNSIIRSGFNISNIGPRLKYDVGGKQNFIPTNLKFGTGFEVYLEDDNALSFNFELNKLLVPTPIATYDESNNFLGYKQPDIGFLKGMMQSFNDAPDGFKEELKEVTWALGFEYVFKEIFSLRTGYFNESKTKGARRYLTFGTGFLINQMNFNVSYLFSTSNVRSPLENTLRFSLAFNILESI
ncbi:MAG: type IX secretion system outer membrane channel protein PorV [Flavobacteriaceae bacterium]|nr:type IX secretion system outer membrane channel protein PorV [Flavobacteriaceae bacterium]